MTYDGRRRFADVPRSTKRVASDVDDEIRFDIDMRTRELVAQGVPPDAACQQATGEFGSVDETRDYCRDLDAQSERSGRRSAWLSEWREDAVITWRGMRRMPAFVSVVLMTLAMGIGANTAIFSVVRRILIDRLPYREPQELVRLYYGSKSGDGSGMLSPSELSDLASAPSFAGVSAFGNVGGSTYIGGQSAEIWASASVTPNFFALLGVRAVAGRAINDLDVGPDASPVVLISHALWLRAFGGDPSIVGKIVQLNGRARTLVGVMPADFVSPTFSVDAWMPLDFRQVLRDPARARMMHAFRGIGRLRPGMSIDRARTDASTIAARWRADRLDATEIFPPRIVPLRDAMVGDVRPALLAVMGAAILVLVITCINIAGLFLARAAARRREIAVRAALGAGRGRLIRQLLTESALYGLAGGAIGVGLAFAARNVLARVAAESLPRLGDVRIDLGMLATAAIVSLVCGLAFGLLPALAATRVNLTESLGDSGRGASQSGSRARARHVLVTAQIALAVVLMVGAGLLVRSFVSLVRTDLGYASDMTALTFRINLPRARFAEPALRNAFFADLLTRIHAMRGVKSAGLTEISPWNGPNNVRPRTDAAQPIDDANAPSAAYMTATEDYFASLGMPVLQGRSIRADDRLGAPGVVVISESLARRLFPSGHAIGSRLIFDGGGVTKGDAWREVVGVVGDVRANVMRVSSPALYVSDWQEGGSGAEFVVRSSGDAAALIPELRRALHDMDPLLPLIAPRTLSDVLHGFIVPQELSMTLMAAFATLALALAALGVYAVMAYAVAARTREFGIRGALGATSGSLVMLVVRQGMTTAGVGAVVGLGLAFSGARLLERLLSGVSTHDAVTFAAAPVLLLVVALVACLLPARTATRVQPVEALRAD